ADAGRPAGMARSAGAALRSLLDWRPLLLAALTFLGLLAVFQLPLVYSFQVGLDRGAGTDRPFLAGFRDPELVTWDDSWRWTLPEAAVTVPGVGGRPLLVAFEVVSHRQHWEPGAPQPVLTVETGAGPPVQIPLRFEVSHYELYVPAAAVRDGALRLRLSSEGWVNPSDPRGELGVAVGRLFRVSSAPGAGPAWPGGGVLAAYPAAIVLLFLAARGLGFGRDRAALLLLAPLLALFLLAALTPPRVAASSVWALETAALTLATAAVCALAVPPLLRRWELDPGPALMPWLLLVVALGFVLKVGGQLHPVAMPGDLGFHSNRLHELAWGQVYLSSLHRGLPFPYPSGWYILVAPLALTGAPIGAIFEVTAGLADAASALLFYVLLARLTGSRRAGVLAALIVTLSPIPMMNVWWSFQAQVGTQLLTTILLTVLILGWPRYGARRTAGAPSLGWLTALLIMVSLGHIGAFINTGLVLAAAVPWLWLRARTAEERAGARRLLWAGLAAAAFALIFFYSAYAGLVGAQLSGVAEGGLPGLTEREPLPRAVWLRALWAEGLLGLNGFFLVPLGLAGALLVSWTPSYRAGIVGPLIWLTLAVGLAQAALPLITQSSITTRWLTFAGWALTVGATVAALRLGRRGRAGRLVVGLALAYVAWVTLQVWATAMALNQPPLEPF
ncbi:MAG TPA: hypothetical protein PKD53_13745, partial [Chloroflexaceae bacterium]|nr:hypothetical protein [Chloroflexaceae bacterium]